MSSKVSIPGWKNCKLWRIQASNQKKNVWVWLAKNENLEASLIKRKEVKKDANSKVGFWSNFPWKRLPCFVSISMRSKDDACTQTHGLLW